MYNVKRKLCKVTPEIIRDCKLHKNHNGFPNYKTQINYFVMLGTSDRIRVLRKLATHYFIKALNVIRDTSITDKMAAKKVKKILYSVRKLTSQSKPKLFREFMQHMALQINYYDSKESFEKYSVLYEELLEKELGKANSYESLKELRGKVSKAKDKCQKIYDLADEKYSLLLYPYFNNTICNIENFVLCLRRWIKDKIFYIFDTNYGESYVPII